MCTTEVSSALRSAIITVFRSLLVSCYCSIIMLLFYYHNVMQEIQLEDLQIAVCAIECFLTTKVASIDPDFIAQTDLVSQ